MFNLPPSSHHIRTSAITVDNGVRSTRQPDTTESTTRHQNFNSQPPSDSGQSVERESARSESGGRPRWDSSEIVRKEKFWWPSGSSSHLSQTQRTLEIKTMINIENKIFVKMSPSLGRSVMSHLPADPGAEVLHSDPVVSPGGRAVLVQPRSSGVSASPPAVPPFAGSVTPGTSRVLN